MGKDKAFTFDYVYDMEHTQQEIYQSCANALIEGWVFDEFIDDYLTGDNERRVEELWSLW